MSFYAIDLVKTFLENWLFGSTALMGIFIVIVFIGILLVCKAYPEVVLFLPMPVLVALAESGIIPLFFKAIIYIIAGLYLGVIILTLFHIK